jgi:DNA-binding transcriptional MerR regulator
VKAGWSLAQLVQVAGVPARTIRLYLQERVLARPPFKGTATRYQRSHLLALLVIRRLRESENLSLAEIRKRLNGMSAKELETIATADVAPGVLADALGLKTRAVAPGGEAGGVVSLERGRWVRWELALGLELHVREDASSQVQALAVRLREVGLGGVEVSG